MNTPFKDKNGKIIKTNQLVRAWKEKGIIKWDKKEKQWNFIFESGKECYLIDKFNRNTPYWIKPEYGDDHQLTNKYFEIL